MHYGIYIQSSVLVILVPRLPHKINRGKNVAKFYLHISINQFDSLSGWSGCLPVRGSSLQYAIESVSDFSLDGQYTALDIGRCERAGSSQQLDEPAMDDDDVQPFHECADGRGDSI